MFPSSSSTPHSSIKNISRRSASEHKHQELGLKFGLELVHVSIKDRVKISVKVVKDKI
jgi:hypothetical protein